MGEVRGRGLMAALEIVRDKKSKEPFPAAANVGLYLERRCQEHGVILRALGDVLTVAPPLIISGPGDLRGQSHNWCGAR